MKKILAIDGGGVHGVIPARILSQLELLTNQPMYKTFDLFAGTSTGGIICCGLTKPISAAKILKYYLEYTPEIFPKRMVPIIRRKYSNKPLTKFIRNILGNDYFSKSIKHTMIPTYFLPKREAMWHKSWDQRFGVQKTWNVVLSGASAPTYFCSNKGYIDGGIFANNPAADAVAAARGLWPGEDLYVLSLGTGESTRPYKDNCGGGIFWANKIVSVFMDGQADRVDKQLLMDPGVKYCRLQTHLTKAYDDIDRADEEQLSLLMEEADDLMEKEQVKIRKLMDVLL